MLAAASDLIADEQWRLSPWRFAQKASYGRFIPYKHVRVTCDIIQREIAKGNARIIINWPPRHGKLVADETPVLTDNGWTTHGKLCVGDYVFGPDGHRTMVVAESAPSYATLRVTLADGSWVDVHPNHEWTVNDRGQGGKKRILTTAEMHKRLCDGGSRGPARTGAKVPRAAFFLPDVRAVRLPGRDLIMHPYVLGAWLGDGSSTKPADRAIVVAIVSHGYPMSTQCTHATTGCVTTYFSGANHRGPGSAGRMTRELRALGVMGNKHIPDAYKLGSEEQRLHLMAGLVDTDGHVEKRTGRVRIVTVSKRLAEDVLDVATTLGWRPYLTAQGPARSTSGIVGTRMVYTVGFQPDRPLPTVLPRKRVTRFAVRRRRAVASIDIAPMSKRGKCIQVDRADGLYLVGRSLIPTHNSTLTSHWLPVWYLNWYPEKRVVMASYGSSLAKHWGRIVRNELATSPYSWTTLAQDSKAAGDFITPQGGGMLSVGTSGTATGRGGDLVLVDDIHKDWAEAQSPVKRQTTLDFFDGTLYTRKEPGASVIVNHTRWHERDLSGFLINEHSDKWTVINMPGLAEGNDILGRALDEALCPERYTTEDLLNIKRAIGSRKFASLYQQHPSPAEGGVIKRDWFRHYVERPKETPELIQSWDLSLKGDKQSDYVVGQTWCRNGPDRYLLDQIRGQMDFPATVNAVLAMMSRWPETTAVYIEDAANGPAVISVLRKKVSRIIAVQARGSKLARLSAVAPAYESGNVWHPDPSICPWVGDLEEELVTFPNAENDDQVDALSMSLGKYLLKSETTAEWSL